MGALFGFLGSFVTGIFGMKREQGEVLSNVIKSVESVNTSDAADITAKGNIVVSEATSGYWLTACWRPLLMIFFAVLIGMRWFGYSPPNMSPSEILELYGLLKLGIGGYIGGRTIEKVVDAMNLGSILKTYLAKKLV